MSKSFNTPRKKWILITAITGAILVAGLVAVRFTSPNVGFKYFEPTNLPSGISIKAKRIGIFDNNAQINQNFRTEDWVYAIDEYKSDNRNGSATIGHANQDYDPKSVKPTCSILKSSTDLQYRLCHWIDYERINVFEVTFIKDGTFIQSKIPTDLNTDISIKEIDEFVDSFREKSTFGLPVLSSNGA